MAEKQRPVILVVLDGWGIGRDDESNPIHVVQPQHFAELARSFPMTSLQASGINVGLPWGEVGNSEVGHLTLGAGKVIYQYYPQITLSIRDKSFFSNLALRGAAEHARTTKGTVHFAGLLSKGNVHASIDHIKALIQFAEQENIPFVFHLFADGKDSPPKTLESFLAEIPREHVATLTGRYYAMDREGNWSLTQRAYETLTNPGKALSWDDVGHVIQETYRTNATEEFLPPLCLKENAHIKDGDALFFFNYREDSIRQIAESFILPTFENFSRKTIENLYVATMTRYESRFEVPVAFEADHVELPLGKHLSDLGRTQLRLAESYKYAHVTYFFNGHVEPPYPSEFRVLVPSQHTLHADEHPEMMAKQITDRLVQAIEGRSFDFILVNYANGDTIGHTGNYVAALDAVRSVDESIGRVVEATLASDSILVITADHGNIEEVIDPMTGLSETQHDANPVPFHLVANEFRGRGFAGGGNLREAGGMLSDVAPTILALMGIPHPPQMTGRNLLADIL